MKKEVAKHEASSEVATTDLDWGTQEISSNDIMISKILPMQGMSKMVLARKASIGEYRDSVTGEKLGSIDEPLLFVPFHVERHWRVQAYEKGKFVYKGMEPVTKANEGRKWEMTVDGVVHRYDWNYTYYVLLVKDLEKGTPIPYTLSFARTSVKSGKKLFTQMFVKNHLDKSGPAGRVIGLLGTMTSNEKGTYIVLDVDVERPTTQKEKSAAFEFFTLVKKGGVSVDKNLDEEEVVTTAPKQEYANDDDGLF